MAGNLTEVMHAHRCGNCLKNGVQTIWIHSDACKGKVQEHTCPKCGQVEWKQFLVPPKPRACPHTTAHNPQAIEDAFALDLIFETTMKLLNVAVMTVLLIYFGTLAFQELRKIVSGEKS